MGCVHSKENKRKGLFTQQEDIVVNNNKVCQPEDQNTPHSTTNNTPTPISRHSPPSSRPPKHPLPHPNLEGLGGGLSEVWSAPSKWNQFKYYLTSLDSEGEDSEGRLLGLARYVTFLELYVRLDREWREGEDQGRLRDIVKSIASHQEGFLDRERCLRCVDMGIRGKVLESVRKVEEREVEAGPHVFLPMYPRVVDKLSELLGIYQNKLLADGGGL